MLAAAGALFAGAACGVQAPGADSEPPVRPEPVAAYTLSVALPEGAASTEQAGAAAFEALVEALSGGAIAVDVASPAASCGRPGQCLEALQGGSLDITRAATEEIAPLFPAIRILDVPYLLDSDAVVDRVFGGPFYARLRDALVDRAGVRPMAIGSSTGWRTLATTDRAVRTPEDLRGRTLAIAGSPIEAELLTALGAVPAAPDRSDLARALDGGAVDGATLPLSEIVGLGLHERLRHVTLDRHSYDAALWLISDASHQGLPAPLRQVVDAGFAELARLTLAAPAEREASAIRAVEAAGGAVHFLSAAERRDFQMAAGRVATGFVETYGHEWLVWLEGAIAEAEREIAVARAGESTDRR